MHRHRKLKVLARFQPRVVADLMPGLAKVIGTDSVFTYSRQMDEDEPLPGEWILEPDDDRFGDYWIPECDLEIIKQYPKGRLRH